MWFQFAICIIENSKSFHRYVTIAGLLKTYGGPLLVTYAPSDHIVAPTLPPEREAWQQTHKRDFKRQTGITNRIYGRKKMPEIS